MKITLTNIKPGFDGYAFLTMMGTGVLWGVTIFIGDRNELKFLMESWLVWIPILSGPVVHGLTHLSLKYFHIMQRIQNEPLRKMTSGFFGFWVGLSSQTTLLYAEFEGDDEAILRAADFFAKNFEHVQLRIGESVPGKKRKMQLLNNAQIFHEMAFTKIFTDPGAK